MPPSLNRVLGYPTDGRGLRYANSARYRCCEVLGLVDRLFVSLARCDDLTYHNCGTKFASLIWRVELSHYRS